MLTVIPLLLLLIVSNYHKENFTIATKIIIRVIREGFRNLSHAKKSVKNWPKNCVLWAKNAVFGNTIQISVR